MLGVKCREPSWAAMRAKHRLIHVVSSHLRLTGSSDRNWASDEENAWGLQVQGFSKREGAGHLAVESSRRFKDRIG
eukprot:scaffold105370_cov18-Tisochrysis_lutea.AAC.1